MLKFTVLLLLDFSIDPILQAPFAIFPIGLCLCSASFSPEAKQQLPVNERRR